MTQSSGCCNRLTRLTLCWLLICACERSDALSLPNLLSHCSLHRSTIDRTERRDLSVTVCVPFCFQHPLIFKCGKKSHPKEAHLLLQFSRSVFRNTLIPTVLTRQTRPLLGLASSPPHAADGITPHSRRIQSTHQHIL